MNNNIKKKETEESIEASSSMMAFSNPNYNSSAGSAGSAASATSTASTASVRSAAPTRFVELPKRGKFPRMKYNKDEV